MRSGSRRTAPGFASVRARRPVSDSDDSRHGPRLPADFSVDDILRAPLGASEPVPGGLPVGADQEARAALWELDFALQELTWFRHEGVDEGPLLQSVARQIVRGAVQVERFPLEQLPLPDDLNEALAERFARLSDALEELPSGWVGHEDVVRAHSCLRNSLECRDVQVD